MAVDTDLDEHEHALAAAHSELVAMMVRVQEVSRELDENVDFVSLK